MPRETTGKEDIPMQINLLMKNPQVYILQEPVYFYRIGPNIGYTSKLDVVTAVHTTVKKRCNLNGTSTGLSLDFIRQNTTKTIWKEEI